MGTLVAGIRALLPWGPAPGRPRRRARLVALPRRSDRAPHRNCPRGHHPHRWVDDPGRRAIARVGRFHGRVQGHRSAEKDEFGQTRHPLAW